MTASRNLKLTPVAMKWLGHAVEIAGTMIAGDAWSLKVSSNRKSL
jgi:hypothetical protein